MVLDSFFFIIVIIRKIKGIGLKLNIRIVRDVKTLKLGDIISEKDDIWNRPHLYIMWLSGLVMGIMIGLVW